MSTVNDKCIRCDWGTAMGTVYCAPCLSILVSLERGEQPTVDDPLDAPPERAILQDLIAELVGDDGDGHEMTPDGEACAVCVAIDRAEARLREVQGE